MLSLGKMGRDWSDGKGMLSLAQGELWEALSWDSGSLHESTKFIMRLPCAWRCGHISGVRSAPSWNCQGRWEKPKQQPVGLSFTPEICVNPSTGPLPAALGETCGFQSPGP